MAKGFLAGLKEKAEGLMYESDEGAATPTPMPNAAPVAAGDPLPIEEDISKMDDQEVIEYLRRKNARSGAAVTAEQPGPNVGDVKVPVTAPPPPTAVTAEGDVAFDGVYALAGLTQPALTAEAMLDILNTIPTDTPIATKRAILGSAIGALQKHTGGTTESVIADATRKIAALHSFEEHYLADTDSFVKQAEVRVATLEAQIADWKGRAAQAQNRAQKVQSQLHTRAEQLDDILEFFSLDVAPSKHAPAEQKSG